MGLKYQFNSPIAFLFVPCSAVVTGGELLEKAAFFVEEGAGDDDNMLGVGGGVGSGIAAIGVTTVLWRLRFLAGGGIAAGFCGDIGACTTLGNDAVDRRGGTTTFGVGITSFVPRREADVAKESTVAP